MVLEAYRKENETKSSNCPRIEPEPSQEIVLGAGLEPSEITCRIVDYGVFAANLTTVRFFAPRQIRQ
jgi:hypothetical protein